ncbi:MAG: hypothetical protein QUS14_05375 [Pyrinomonadaceae bacterium]|nr:hypothetical protein [Pyrinomonadaceae bacterium]
MAEYQHSDFDSFRKEVFERVYSLYSPNDRADKLVEDVESGRGGCLSLILRQFIPFAAQKSREKYREVNHLAEHERNASLLLQDAEIKSKICELLTESDVLPMDVAHKITPMLYEMATAEPDRVPKEPIMFAVIARNIAQDGVANYCRA